MANLRRLQNYEGFIQFMNKEFSSFLKKDFRKEIRGVGVKYKRFPLIERENVIGETLGMMEARWEKSLFDDKRYNPLIGFHSVSGGGKSYLVDELVGLNLKDAKVMEKYGQKLDNQEQFANEFNQSIRIPVTFNKWATSDIFKDDPSKDIGSRLLYSYFMSEGDFREFQRIFLRAEKTDWLQNQNALMFIAQHHQQTQNATEKPRIIVLLDEIMKASQPEALLRNICAEMETAQAYAKSLDVLSTALYPEVLESQSWCGGRYVHIIPLPMLSKIELLFPPEENGAVYEIAVRCGGHPRTLSLLYETSKHKWYVKKFQEANTLREDSLKDPSKPMSKSTIDTFKELWDTIREEASAFSFGLVESDVVDPILSNYIEPESVDTKGEKISDKIINGVYLNAIKESKTDFIPVVSMLQLMHFSEHKYDPLDFAVNDLVEGDLMAAFRGEPFDEFMVHWERVFHECRRLHAQSGRGKWEMRLGDFYSGNVQFMSNVGELCKISIPKDPKRYVTLASADKHGFLAVIAKKNFRSLRYVDFLKGANIVHYNEPGSDYIHCFNGVSQDTRFQPTKVFIHTHYNLWKEGTHVRFDENLLSNLRSAEAQYREALGPMAEKKKVKFDCERKVVRLLDPFLQQQFKSEFITPVLIVTAPPRFEPKQMSDNQREEIDKSFITVGVLPAGGLMKLFGPSIAYSRNCV